MFDTANNVIFGFTDAVLKRFRSIKGKERMMRIEERVVRLIQDDYEFNLFVQDLKIKNVTTNEALLECLYQFLETTEHKNRTSFKNA